MSDTTPTPAELRQILARTLFTVHDGDLDRAAHILTEARTNRGLMELVIGACQLYIQLLDETHAGGADNALTRIAVAMLTAEEDDA